MALLDSQLVLSNNQSLAVSALGVAQNMPPIDLMGVGVGNAPPNYYGVQDVVFGEDIGIGDGVSPPNITCIVGMTFVGAGATLTVELQESVDSGAAGSPPFSPNAWQTIAATGALTPAQLLAGTKIADLTIPPRAPGQAFPRFFQLYYSVVGTFTAGAISFAGIATGRDDAPMYPAAY